MTLLNRRRAKIVCTLGPVTSSSEMIEKLVLCGMNVARLNFSHGTHSEHLQRINALRRISRKHGRPIAVLADLQGPKIRTGAVLHNKPIQLRFGQRLVITTKTIVGTPETIST